MVELNTQFANHCDKFLEKRALKFPSNKKFKEDFPMDHHRLILKSVFTLTLTVTSCVQQRHHNPTLRSASVPLPSSTSWPSLEMELEAYVQDCQVALGSKQNPAPIPEVSCLSDEMFPIQIRRDENDRTKCHNPSALLGVYVTTEDYEEDLCAEGSRMQSQTLGDVIWVTVCRKYQEHENDALFDDVNMIGYNTETGVTCFFNSHTVEDKATQPLDFSKPIHVSRDATRMFMTPSQIQTKAPCLSCHTASPFLRSPHLHAGHSSKAGYVAPLIPITAKMPYRPIWQASLVAPRLSQTIEPLQVNLTGSVAEKSCVSCHQIGSDRYCRDYVPLAWGQIKETSQWKHAVADESQTWPHRLWHKEHIPALKMILSAQDLKTSRWGQALQDIAERCGAPPN